ncbi:lytic murein transglycosylase B [Candidatus Thiothrix anitrata]|jgi:membrane-bound lytic murein transglycosylase B|uniref:Lytic murein transglycosylase B n=1 Tax=Candidatus Thiothrix anitrata TaxID=2823902 RepID=A0ABX7X1H5_9GAMM|nr:lytic murein transglycosylase B [Candidatus Thiothrix anitrata]QTR49777.1 lytic murein transglycosylase B [Candidatus Thiothrix anitrata]
MRLFRDLCTYSAVAVLALGLGACSQTPQKTERDDGVSTVKPKQPIAKQHGKKGSNETPQSVSYGGRGVGNYSAAALSGDFAGNPQLIAFIENLAASNGFDRNYLYGVFSQVRNRDDVARLWAQTSNDPGSPKGWFAYRDRFVNAANVQRGVEFWRQYGAHLKRAEQTYGVSAEYIVGIMGVETRWGRILGKHRVIDALVTSAITNQRRSNFFFKELKNYMLMTRSERMDPLAPKGSFAGAMGYGQFMPSSFHAFAVDFDGDGIRDLWNPVDAIGSIANYFAKHGWQRGGVVAVPARVGSDAYASMPDGFKVKYTASSLAARGIVPQYGNGSGTAYLLALSTVPGGYKEPWIGYNNFYTITRYNHSNYYAMAVHLLSQGIRGRVGK